MSVGVKALPVPADDNDYLCVFGDNWTVVGAVSPNEIKCYTPPRRLFAPLFNSVARGRPTNTGPPIIIIIINDSIYPAVSKASRTGNKVSCQPNDCPNR